MLTISSISEQAEHFWILQRVYNTKKTSNFFLIFAGAWSAEDIPVVNVPQLARPHQSNFSSHFLGYTCWPFVFYCLWFPKLVLRGTFIPCTWRWMGGHPTEEQINLPLTDLLCSPGYQTVKSFIWKSKHGMKLRLCCRTKTCAVLGFFWQGSASSNTQMKVT